MKQSEFNIFTPGWTDNSILCFNSFTGSFITLSSERFRLANQLFANRIADGVDPAQVSELSNVLRRGGFLIEDGVNERQALAERYHQERARTRGLTLTIAPTTSCNLRCTYCFEEHPNRKMSDQDIADALAFVRNNLVENTFLGVTWFGGEPMLTVERIAAFAQQLRQEAERKKCGYQQSLITNGVLFTRKNGDILAEAGAFSSVQITLDGPPAIHDKRRFTVAEAGTFDQILENLQANADRFPIVIRVNVDRTNYEHLAELLDILDNAGLRNRLSLYLGHAYSYSDTAGNLGGKQLNIQEFAAVEAQFKWHMFTKGFMYQQALPTPQLGPHCIADNPYGVLVSPGGLAFKCWNETALGADKAIGSLSGLNLEPPVNAEHSSPAAIKLNSIKTVGESQAAVRQGWEDYLPTKHQDCKSCRVAPLCLGGCPWEVRSLPESNPTGHCTPLKFNIEDTLRLHHLMATVSKSMTGTLQPPEASTVCAG